MISMIWLEFILCSALLIYFAYNLCREGIILSERTNIEKGIIGMFFLAVATSFPEIVTGASAVFFLDKAALGYGDIVGSIIVNLMILFGIDIYQGKGRILLRVSKVNRLTGVYVVILLGIVLSAAMIRSIGVSIPVIYGVGIENFLIILTYFAALKIIQRSGKREEHVPLNNERESFLSLWSKFMIFLAVVMALGVWLARIGDKIVAQTTMSETFIGTLFLGLVTSFPEIIVSFAALRAGSINMAVGNILGSNMFDVCIIPFLDMLHKRPILGAMTNAQKFATVLVTVLSLVAVIGLYSKKETSRKVGWDTAIIFLFGLIGFVILYYIR